MQKENVFILGDVHDQWNAFEETLRAQNIHDAAIFQIGDFCLGFQDWLPEQARLAAMNRELRERNIHLSITRGNHDDPAYFRRPSPFSHIQCMPDYSVHTLNGKRILSVGGAISIDRQLRQPGKRYWTDEAFTLQTEAVRHLTGIDLVLTHSAPDFAFPSGNGPRVASFLKNDPALADELVLERRRLGQLYQLLKANRNLVSHWYYGHFHQSHSFQYEQTKFVLLDMLQFCRANW